MVAAVAVLGTLTFLAVLRTLQPTLVAGRARREGVDEVRRTVPFLRRRDVVLAPSAFCVCAVAAGSAFVDLDGAWPVWAGGAGAALALGLASRGAAPRLDAVLDALGVELGDRERHRWLEATTVLFAATWVVRLLATHEPLAGVAGAQIVLLPALTVCAGVAAWHALRRQPDPA